MSEQITEAESPICYLINLDGNQARFIWSSNPFSQLESSLDLKSRVSKIELLYLADILNCPVKENMILPSNLELYSRLLIYASVRPTIRGGSGPRDLAQLVMNLNGIDTNYWASRFRELWWRHGHYRPLMKASKSFKLFFGLI